MGFNSAFKGLKAELIPICHLLTLLGAHHIFHVSVLRVNNYVMEGCSGSEKSLDIMEKPKNYLTLCETEPRFIERPIHNNYTD